MSSKKSFFIFFIICLFAVFSLSYYYSKNKLNSVPSKVNDSRNSSKVDSVTSFNSQDTVSPNAKVIINTEYKKSGSELRTEDKSGTFIGKSVKEIEAMGYTMESMSSKQIILNKRVDKYAPNKYVLGIKENKIAIFKTDSEGNLYIEDEKNDITDIDISKLKQGDIDLLNKGTKDFEFNTREDAEAKLEDYI